MIKQNLLIGLMSIIFGIIILIFSEDLNMFDEYGVLGERFWPFLLAILFILLGILQIVNTLKDKAIKNKEINFSSSARKKVYLLFLLMTIYGVGLIYLGFIISTIILIPIIMKMMGENQSWRIVLSTLGIVSSIYIFFEIIFNSPLPASLLLE
ncbi:tripartite tricarboxylate transporter TctB family protein [Lonepinella koalarum]|uniref:Tripartite tricarboxylate transporter TctB family protein n=1 Tax=Lonepinella koalarum TaxID=53417 RepID=A0A4R1L005_9PAST|nr:tripartite tricarboxylate transporter TctB family protein [Lonepinella koalarum]MDH2926040.1 hypothetical protein [Lonepinella koalarum]TCK71192.1 tripartite tricarboxylate transporter TctB family protein [Lonepinella koalarum]TFJ90918.1 tripartite tricarboxylate transporter TctB family protein [Lonepinella koalarum]